MGSLPTDRMTCRTAWTLNTRVNARRVFDVDVDTGDLLNEGVHPHLGVRQTFGNPGIRLNGHVGTGK